MLAAPAVLRVSQCKFSKGGRVHSAWGQRAGTVYPCFEQMVPDLKETMSPCAEQLPRKGSPGLLLNNPIRIASLRPRFT